MKENYGKIPNAGNFRFRCCRGSNLNWRTFHIYTIYIFSSDYLICLMEGVVAL